ncbi:unnamed protein product [Dicrocoelium dendriticum]|nr:unnamed protein product [Dicrocoelium dendriticum]
MAYYGGIEGGTTGSRMVLLNAEGAQVGYSEGPHTNYWHIGMQEAARRVVMLTEDALVSAGLPKDTKLKSLGLALSGVNTELNQWQITDAVRSVAPNIADKIYACNDAVGALVTATDGDAMVLISGTGSICALIRKDMTLIRIGGLGYLLGDEGSAFWVAHQAIMSYIKVTEGFHHVRHSMIRLAEAIRMHFKIRRHDELLAHFNENIDKTYIAQLCYPLAQAAHEGDQYCIKLFYNAGVHLGRHVSAAVRHADKEGLIGPEGIDVVCCGSVFKSWSLLEAGFYAGLKPKHRNDCRRGRIILRLLQKTAAIGATILAARLELGVNLPRPDNVTNVLCEIDLEEQDKRNN